jgi:glycosidase
VRDVGIDGFRCDVAGFVPTDFWNTVRKELDEIKPVFMLAEWESRDLHEEAFDMTYSWMWYDTMVNIVSGGSVSLLHVYYSWNEKAYPFDIMRMLFTSNHDKNSWDGTMNERFGAARDAVIALTFVSEGMPLIYNSQEAGEEKRLEFFEKDPIQWQEHPLNDFYKKLIALKKKNSALWNAKWGARMVHVPNSAPEKVFSFVRQNEQDKVFAVFNFSPIPQSVTFQDHLFHGTYTDFTSGEGIKLSESTRLELKPWEYRIFIR